MIRCTLLANNHFLGPLKGPLVLPLVDPKTRGRALKIWITCLQAYIPYESSEDSSNQPDGPMGSPKHDVSWTVETMGPPGYPPWPSPCPPGALKAHPLSPWDPLGLLLDPLDPVVESMQARKPGLQAPSNLAGSMTKIPTFFGRWNVLR